MRAGIDFIIPTFSNPQYLVPCVKSVLMNSSLKDFIRLIIVNNGPKEDESWIPKTDFCRVVTPGKNLGWEGGLKLGLEHSDAEYVCFMNDDVFLPLSSHYWLNFILPCFDDPKVAAVGPATNVCMGAQNIFYGPQAVRSEVPYLIGFCVFNRRKYLDEVGGVDTELPGGDDLDLSIRYRKAGYKMVICRTAFIYHHGFKTGERLKGGPDRPMGWNSRDSTDRTNQALIRKHGFKWFMSLWGQGNVPQTDFYGEVNAEGKLSAKYVIGEKVVELGCGAEKTVANSIGVDRVAKGELIPNLHGLKSVADVKADVTALPFRDGEFDTVISRHILEHCVDSVLAVSEWTRILRLGGRMIVALPDSRMGNTILLNPEHKHEYSPAALENFMRLFGMKKIGHEENYNGSSFISVFEKNGVVHV